MPRSAPLSPRTLAAVGAVATFGVVWWLWPRREADPETRIRTLVQNVVQGVEEKNLGPLSDSMADEFRGPSGASKQEVQQMLTFQVLRNRETVAVFNPSLDVKLSSPTSAEIEGTFLFTRSRVKSAAELQPEMVASAYQVSAVLELKGGEWKFVSAAYAPATWP